MDVGMIIGLVVTIVVIAGLSIFSGTRAKGGESAKNGSAIVAGVIIGTLVGGSSTVGTAQLAYNYGMSAWWFTLGGGIACLILAIFYVGPLRHKNCPTLVGMIRQEYGDGAGMAASLLSSVGTFINIISQLISATAVIAVILPTLGTVPALIISAAFMVLYVVFGGTKGAGMVGILKTLLLYVAMMGCLVMVLYLTGGLREFVTMVNGIDNPDGVHFFSLIARGAGEDIGAGLSLVLGVLTTQTYAQAVLSAKSDAAGRRGALLSAFLIPPIGVGGILVGLYMRATHPGIVAKTALTAFTLEYMPPVLAGVILGTLFIAVVGTGAGLALGISTIVSNDIVKKVTHRLDDPKKSGLFSKLCIVLVLALACCLSTGSLGDTILQFAFMSMGLRGAVVFIPLCAALWLPGKIDKKFAIASIIVSPIIVLLFGTVFADLIPIDSLFIGILASIIIMGAGLAAGRKKPEIAL